MVSDVDKLRLAGLFGGALLVMIGAVYAWGWPAALMSTGVAMIFMVVLSLP